MSTLIFLRVFAASRRVRGVVGGGIRVVWFATACLSFPADGSAAAGLRPAGPPLRLRSGQASAAVPTKEITTNAPVHLAGVDSIIQQAIADGLPGAVLVVGHDGRV